MTQLVSYYKDMRWPDEPGFAAAVVSVLGNKANQVSLNIRSNNNFYSKQQQLFRRWQPGHPTEAAGRRAHAYRYRESSHHSAFSGPDQEGLAVIPRPTKLGLGTGLSRDFRKVRAVLGNARTLRFSQYSFDDQ